MIELMPTVKTMALQLAAGPTRGYVRTRQAIDAAMLLPSRWCARS